MSEKYIPLYRKYRPKNLQEVVGQEHIKKALANAINLNKISHAYLFTGPRGTGKTSAARIMAKSLNCQEGPTLTPCGKCPSCVDIMNSVPIDVIEIDAASNRKVEDAQNILEKIQYVPVNGKYKIYIIDEVHMLTNHAFNALLKTLEEPPENVIFILATTEPQKVLETITSRCQRFDFRRISTDDIIGHLKNIAKLEKIKIEEDALSTIAKNAAGGMRDSLALLDQVSVLDGAKTITSDDVNTLLGRLSFDVLNSLSEKILQSQPQEAIVDLEKIYNSGNEPVQILTNLLGYFKNLLIVKNCQGASLLDLTQLNEAQITILKRQSADIDTHQIVFLIDKIVYYIKELKTTNNQHLWLEISMIDLANLAHNTSLLELQERISRLEQKQPAQSVAQPYVTQPAPIAKTQIKAEPPKKEVIAEEVVAKAHEPKPVVEEPIVEEKIQVETQEEEFSPVPKSQPTENPESSDVRENWIRLLELMHKKSPSTKAMLTQHASPVEFLADEIVISCGKEFFFKALNNEKNKKIMQEAGEEFFGKSDVKVTIRMPLPTDKPLDNPAEKKNSIIKPAPKKVERERELEEENLKEELEFAQSQEIHDKPQSKAPKSPKEKAKKGAEIMPSDQVTMVKNLFDGKYID